MDCERVSCRKLAKTVCTKCKLTRYCSESCEKKARKSHKTQCEMQQVISAYEDKEREEKKAKAKKPNKTRCTGCNTKFDEEFEAEDECPDCGYLVCESCSVDQSNGSCYCEKSNFGNLYCFMEPRYYHCSSLTGKSYKGDRHPEPLDDEDVEKYETKPRNCNNCDAKIYCYKKKYL